LLALVEKVSGQLLLLIGFTPCRLISLTHLS
jgi:hypothetical protein